MLKNMTLSNQIKKTLLYRLMKGSRFIMKKKNKVIMIILIVLFNIGLIYICTEVLVPRDYGATATLDGPDANGKIVKEQKDNNYYFDFSDYNNGVKSTIKISCTKEQYNFIVSGKQYHILFKRDYFNRMAATIIQLDDLKSPT